MPNIYVGTVPDVRKRGFQRWARHMPDMLMPMSAVSKSVYQVVSSVSSWTMRSLFARTS